MTFHLMRSDQEMSKIDIEDESFRTWFEGSKAVDRAGKPVLVFRGEHGKPGRRLFQTRWGALSFGDFETAKLYATDPNDHRDLVFRPRIMPVYLKITNPIINTPSDPFFDLSRVQQAFGRDEAVRLAHKFAPQIRGTGFWYELEADSSIRSVPEFLKKHPERLGELYFQAFDYLNDAEEVARLRKAGFDGGIHCGFGDNGTEVEYKVFDVSQVRTATDRWLDPDEAMEFAARFGIISEEPTELLAPAP